MAATADLEFLKKMDARAERLAKKARREAKRLIRGGTRLPGGRTSKDYWAKPFYSDVHTFRPGAPRVFVGINSKGNRHSLEYDKQQQNEQRLWSGNKPFHNAYLDEAWGGSPGGPDEDKGSSHLQVAAQGVFKAMYGASGRKRLRRTPCFNLVPVSSEGIEDPVLDEIWDEGAKWFIELMEYLRPQSIILYGNAKTGRSVWAVLNEEYGLNQTHNSRRIAGWKYRLKQDTIATGVMGGIRVVSMPHLSYMDCHLPVLERKLAKLRSSESIHGC